MSASKQEPKNGDIFWIDEDGSRRKVTKDDIKNGDYSRVEVYIDDEYLAFWDGMVKMFSAS